MSNAKTHSCPLCGGETTTSICGNCASDLEFLGVKDLPSPDAAQDAVADWAKKNNITAFICGKK